MIRPLAARGRRPGNVVPVVCIMLVFLVGMVAFAIDTGYIALTRTQMQRAADAGAHAGAYKLATFEGQPIQDAAARDELKKFVALNEALTVRDADVRVLRYNPFNARGARVLTTYSTTKPPNAVEVTLRRDGQLNGKLPLFFGPVLGTDNADVRARATAYLLPAKGVLPGAPLIPYTMHVDYYFAAVGQPRTDPNGNPIETTDVARLGPDGTVTYGSDGIKEVVLFGSTQNSPGNFGSIDLGTKSNGTPELARQILHGPTWNDFHDPDFRDKLQRDGSLQAPFAAGGDPGLSTSVKEQFEEIIGQPRIVPLYDTVAGSGNNTEYHIVGFAAVVITAVDMQGSPKRIWVQPTRLVTDKITPGDPDTTTSQGVYTPPRLVIP